MKSKSRAKVLSDEWWTWPLFWTWPGKIIETAGNEIDSTLDLTIDGYWRDSNQEIKIQRMASIPIKFTGYSLADQKVIRAGDGTLTRKPSGFFGAPPISVGPDGKAIPEQLNTGTFSVKVVVTEKDNSNAKQRLEDAADFVSKQKDTIIERIKKF